MKVERKLRATRHGNGVGSDGFNQRSAVGGFPRRVPHISVIEPEDAAPDLDGRLRAEFLADIGAVDHVVIAGGCASITDIDTLIQSKTSMARRLVELYARYQETVVALESVDCRLGCRGLRLAT